MEMWQMWAVAGAVLVILEMLTPAMFFLNLALACFGVAAAAFFTVDLYVLVPLWVVLSAIFLLFLRPLLNRRHAAQSTATGMGQYVGKTAKVLEAVGKDSGDFCVTHESSPVSCFWRSL